MSCFCPRAKRRQARLEAAAAQLRQHAGQAQQQQQPEGAELRLGEATSEESEGEASHFRVRQGEILEVSEGVAGE